jgi:nickel/cobalt transporter (NicO) family protein
MRVDSRLVVFCLCLVAAAGIADIALAQGSPFGVGRGPAAAPAPAPDGITGWLLAKQAEFYRALSGLVRAAKADGSAAWTLIGVSFAYGVFHALGPGHGKAVISSYLVANDETWRRGVVLSFASAMLQAIVAVALVGVAAVLLGATARAMSETVRWIEIVSYALIAALGLRLMWVKGRALISAMRTVREPAPAPLGAAVSAPPAYQHAHGHHHHDHAGHHHAHHHGHHYQSHQPHIRHFGQGTDHEPRDHIACGAPGHVHDAHCGHAHGPEPQELAGPGGWQRGLSAIVAVGLRPCSGAILVLVFALAQGLFWAGVVSTFAMGLGTAIAVAAVATLAVGAKSLAVRLASGRGGYGTILIRGAEVAAATLVFAFGALLLTGYMASERLGMM